VLWLPVWMHNKARTCLEITQSRPFSTQRIEVLQGIFRVYQNYQSLLDYSERDALTGLLNRKTFDEQFIRFASLEANASVAAAPHSLSDEVPSSGWRWWTSTTSSRSTTASATCLVTRC
jgi:hypothetical protein